MSYSEDQLASLIAEVLGEDVLISNFLIGSCNGAISGQQVDMGVNDLQAIALNDISPGQCFFFQDDVTKVWYAVPNQVNSVQNQSVIRYYRNRPIDEAKKTANLKILFYANINNGELYLGGDRISPLLLYPIPEGSSINLFSSEISNYLSNHGTDYLASIKLLNSSAQAFKSNLDSQGIYNIPSNLPDNSSFLGNGVFQSSEIKLENAVIPNTDPYGNTYYPLIKMGNYSVYNKEFIFNQSSFTQILTSFIAGSPPSVPPMISSINGTDGRGNAYEYTFEVTPDTTSGSSIVNAKTKISGDFLVCEWDDGYVMEKVASYESNLSYDRLNLNINYTITYQSSKSYHLHTLTGTKQLNSDDAIVFSFVQKQAILNSDKTSLTIVTYSGQDEASADWVVDAVSQADSPVLCGYRYSNKLFYLIRGTISSFTKTEFNNFQIVINIQEIKTRTYISFAGKLFSDNGSWLAYFHLFEGQFPGVRRGGFNLNPINVRMSKESSFCSNLASSLKRQEAPILVQTDQASSSFFTSTSGLISSIVSTDNLVGNRIYRCQQLTGQTYPATKNIEVFVEEWDITTEGLIKYSGRVKKVSANSAKLKGSIIAAMSYHP